MKICLISSSLESLYKIKSFNMLFETKLYVSKSFDNIGIIKVLRTSKVFSSKIEISQLPKTCYLKNFYF